MEREWPWSLNVIFYIHSDEAITMTLIDPP